MNLWFEQILTYLVLVIFHLRSILVDNQATSPSRDKPTNSPQALYCPPGAPFGPVHFTKYLPNPAYLEYNLEIILIADSLARTNGTKYIGHKGKRIKVPPLLFKYKFDYLPAYFVPMTPPLTPQPNHSMEPITAIETTSTQLFGVLYITLTGLVDSMVPNCSPQSMLGQSISYIIKLVPILWWVLPTGPAVLCPKSTNVSTYAWIPEIMTIFYKHGNLGHKMLLTLGCNYLPDTLMDEELTVTEGQKPCIKIDQVNGFKPNR
ncbi:hypothetical protein DSO57_1021137 [Entomophthora muscae]|uniref:Uncharacterized protein n=1 Tax=Entomophthora muscae TaxID=34485 RepID=A0ACC2S5D5_9FUNG|nr:hypothetical protein DSO57_1021137 [Entomophthora muscae]